jgi:hypothetical protein
MKKVGDLIHWLVAASLLLAAIGGALDIYRSGALTPEHMWNDSILLMLLAVVLVHAL